MKTRIIGWATIIGLYIVMAGLVFLLVGATLHYTGVWPGGPRWVGDCRAS